jgi:hypothetical protein
LGQYATPPALAALIAREALGHVSSQQRLGHRSVRVLEPAAGTGSFLTALLRVLPEQQLERVLAVELDPHLATSCAELWASRRIEVRPADFTELRPPAVAQRFTLLLSNPPYSRHHHLTPAQKARLKERAERASGIRPSGLSGLHVYFVLIAHAFLAEGAVSAWLLPAEFLSVGYGLALRRYFGEKTQLLRVHWFEPEDLRFADALVSSCVVLTRHGAPAPSSTFTRGAFEAPRFTREVRSEELAGGARWTPLFEAPVVTPRVKRGPTELGMAFQVRRGIATGNNAFFVRELAEWTALGVPRQHLTPVLPAPRHLKTDIVERLRDGWPRLGARLALLDVRTPRATLEHQAPALCRLLAQAEADGHHLRYLARHRSPWYAQEHREPTPFVCTYMGRSEERPFRFVLNHSAAVATNVYLMLQPRPALAAALTDEPALAVRLHAALASLDARALERQGRVYGGGLHKLEPRELAGLPADAVADVLPDRLRRALLEA